MCIVAWLWYPPQVITSNKICGGKNDLIKLGKTKSCKYKIIGWK